MKTNLWIATIMQIAKDIYKQEIFLEPETGEFLRKEITEQGIVYYPITYKSDDITPAPYLHLNENELFSIDDILKLEKNVEKQINSSFKAVEIRIKQPEKSGENRAESGQESGKNHFSYQNLKEKKAEKKRIEILRNFGLEPFHEKFTGNFQAKILELETITAELLSDTHKQQTIDGIITLFYQAKDYAKKQDYYHLSHIVEKLQKKRNQQLAAIQLNKNKRKKKLLSDRIKIILTIIIFTLIFSMVLYSSFSKNKPLTNVPSKETKQIKEKTYIFELEEIYQFIDEYEKKKQVKIYQWRRGKILQAFPDTPITKQQAFKIIDSIATKKF